jgi:hypothetical protein
MKIINKISCTSFWDIEIVPEYIGGVNFHHGEKHCLTLDEFYHWRISPFLNDHITEIITILFLIIICIYIYLKKRGISRVQT